MPISTSASIQRWRNPLCELAGAAISACPVSRTVPIGVGATHDFHQEVGAALEVHVTMALRPDVEGASDLWSPRLHGG